MKHHHPLLLALLTSHLPYTTSTNTAVELQGPIQESSSGAAPTITATSSESIATVLEVAAQPAPIAARFQARQHGVAARTTSEVVTSITTLPTPTPTTPTSTSTDSSSSDDSSASETSGSDSASDEAPSSTITITVTSNRTTTIRPTVTVTSLFSSIGATTSGASGRVEPLVFVHGFIRTLILIFSLGAVWV
ncbi:hypothetical protein F4859DRAFT_434977 [Xylaria cf. heliscus]|nr:hypothetical protein F4859DRAFT_434977 [Xylaria cf. heliscus]